MEKGEGSGSTQSTGNGDFRRRPWRCLVAAYEQPGGSRGVVSGAKERGRGGGLVDADGEGNGGVNRRNKSD